MKCVTLGKLNKRGIFTAVNILTTLYSRSHNFIEYTDSIVKLLSIQLMYQPNEYLIMMEYIPYIKQMITANDIKNSKSTRSKRKRLYLPLSDDAIQILTCHKPIIDEVTIHS